MFKFDEQCNPRQISLTGVRAIVILALLNLKPCTFQEIKEFLITSNIVTREYSIDTIRIDLNTLKYIGCDISKATKKTNNMYILRSHPFQLTLDEDEVETLAKIYKNIYKNLSIERILEYDKLFEKLADAIQDEHIKEYLRGISVLKGLDKNLINELLSDSYKNTRLTIEYKPGASKTVEYDITVEKLAFRSDKLYIYCYNHTINKRTFLNFSRLKKILARALRSESVDSEDVCVEFELKNSQNYSLEETEEIISQQGDVIKVKGAYYTDFIALQRMLYFGPDCVVISPDNFKEQIVAKLQSMRSLYD